MEIIKSVANLRKKLDSTKGKVGFVPTMGALHAGHLSLVENAKKKSAIVVVSIFVNPTQFNDKDDLKKYPRNLDKDAALLKNADVDILFAPDVEDVYPKGLDTKINVDLGQLDKVMEGEFRPGHFDGVVEVVYRLLDIVKPDYLYMGQKDFQQFTIINHMLKVLKMKVKLIVCPILREPHGLAMSSRNERLDPAVREEAAVIYKVLKSIKRRRNSRTLEQLKAYASRKLNKLPFKLEYLEFADGNTLQTISTINDSNYVVACIVVWAGDVRLIDNIILKQ